MFLACGHVAQPATAADFRIATKIFVGEEESPASETTTLFRDGTVYDFLANPDQTAVFRKPGGGKAGRFILLDNRRRVQTEISTESLAGAMSKLKEWAARQRDPFLRFAAAPQFDEKYEIANGKLILTSHLESYTVTTRPVEQPEALAEYREFLDWYAQLNTLLSGGPPPEPRLRLNEALARRKTVPLEVELTRAGEDPVRAEHEFHWRLSREDEERIDDVRTALASYRQVKNEEYLSLTQPRPSK
jgi:hypothetical protein